MRVCYGERPLARVDDLIWLDDSLKRLPSWFGNCNTGKLAAPLCARSLSWLRRGHIDSAGEPAERVPPTRACCRATGAARWRLTFVPVGRGPDHRAGLARAGSRRGMVVTDHAPFFERSDSQRVGPKHEINGESAWPNWGLHPSGLVHQAMTFCDDHHFEHG